MRPGEHPGRTRRLFLVSVTKVVATQRVGKFKLKEVLARLVNDVMRLAVGLASGVVVPAPHLGSSPECGSRTIRLGCWSSSASHPPGWYRSCHRWRAPSLSSGRRAGKVAFKAESFLDLCFEQSVRRKSHYSNEAQLGVGITGRATACDYSM
jgi:hypothetical protein